MRLRSVYYDLEQGFIHNWLVAGPQILPMEHEQFGGENTREQIVQRYYQRASGITETPVERGPLSKGLFQLGGYAGSWRWPWR